MFTKWLQIVQITIRYELKKGNSHFINTLSYNIKVTFQGKKTKTNNLVINQYKMLSNMLELALFGWEKYYEGGV